MTTPISPPPAHTVRAVWAIVSRRPAATIDEIAASCGISRTTAHRALCDLAARGYIEAPARAHGARRVIVPLMVQL